MAKRIPSVKYDLIFPVESIELLAGSLCMFNQVDNNSINLEELVCKQQSLDVIMSNFKEKYFLELFKISRCLTSSRLHLIRAGHEKI